MLKQICSLPIFRLKIRQKLPRDCDKERDFMTPPTFSLLIPSLLLYWRRWGAHVLSPWERKTSLIFCTGCTGKSMVRWTDGENPMISGCSTSSITSLPSGTCPKAMSSGSLSTSLSHYQQNSPHIMWDEEPWVCREDLKEQPGDDIKLCCFCFLPQLSWPLSLFLCLHPSQQQCHLLSVFRLSSSLSSLLKDAPQVSAPIIPVPHQWRCYPSNSMPKLHASDKYLNDLTISHRLSLIT